MTGATSERPIGKKEEISTSLAELLSSLVELIRYFVHSEARAGIYDRPRQNRTRGADFVSCRAQEETRQQREFGWLRPPNQAAMPPAPSTTEAPRKPRQLVGAVGYLQGLR